MPVPALPHQPVVAVAPPISPSPLQSEATSLLLDAQARLLADGGAIIDREGQRSRRAEHLHLGRLDLEAAGGDIRVLVARRALAHGAHDPQAVLIAQAMCDVGIIDDDLYDAAGIAQVEEGHTAVVATPVHPSGKRDLGALVHARERAGPVRADHDAPSSMSVAATTRGRTSVSGGVHVAASAPT